MVVNPVGREAARRNLPVARDLTAVCPARSIAVLLR